MELLCAKGGEQRETQANELLFMIIFLSHSDTRQSGNVLNVCYLFFRWSFFRSRLFFRKAKHASNRAGKMQQRSAAAAASFDSFFFGMPQFFLMFFFLLSLLFFTFPVLLAQDFGYPFLITKWCLEKHQNRNFKFLTCQKPHTSSSYPIIASENRIINTFVPTCQN